MTTTTDFWADADVIHAYTAADAVADGVSIRLDEKLVADMRINVPVVATRGAYDDAIAWDRGSEEGQSVSGRTWDVLWMMRRAATRAVETGTAQQFELLRIANRTARGALSTSQTPLRTRLVVGVEAYDRSGTPCFVISKLGES